MPQMRKRLDLMSSELPSTAVAVPENSLPTLSEPEDWAWAHALAATTRIAARNRLSRPGIATSGTAVGVSRSRSCGPFSYRLVARRESLDRDRPPGRAFKRRITYAERSTIAGRCVPAAVFVGANDLYKGYGAGAGYCHSGGRVP